jgi:hypothetical protein
MMQTADPGRTTGTFNEKGQAGSGLRYSPDKIVAPMITATASAAIYSEKDFRLALSQASERRFSLEESKNLITAAMQDFDPKLGDKAREIFKTAHYNNGEADENLASEFRSYPYDDAPPNEENPFLDKNYRLDVSSDQRWNLTPAPPGQCRLMRCLAAESEQKAWTETAYDPANPNPHAIIEYQFDGTIDAVVHMAHELGHAIADDYGREAGNTYKDNPGHIAEMQAYLTQHILYDYLKRHPDKTIAAAAQGHFDATLAYNLNDIKTNPAMQDRPASILTARGLYDHLGGQNIETRRQVSEALLGREGSKNINEVLAAAGFKTNDDMKVFAGIAARPVGAAPPIRSQIQKPSVIATI